MPNPALRTLALLPLFVLPCCTEVRAAPDPPGPGGPGNGAAQPDDGADLGPAPGDLMEPPPEPITFPDGTRAIPCGAPLPDMACIEGGAFLRGADDGPRNARPAAIVWLQTYYIDLYEVTYAEYRRCVQEKRCHRSGPLYADFDHPHQPINGVSWYDAAQYCEAHGKRLPTEAEWEKAARGTEGKRYPWGNAPATCERAIIMDESGRGCGVENPRHPQVGRPWPVGSRPPGEYGLYDMAGNSWEWVQDWYSQSYEACGRPCAGINPRGPCDGNEPCPGHKLKIVRGGSWYWPAKYAMTIWRRAHYPSNRPFHHFGFRCAASADQADALREARGALAAPDREPEPPPRSQHRRPRRSSQHG